MSTCQSKREMVVSEDPEAELRRMAGRDMERGRLAKLMKVEGINLEGGLDVAWDWFLIPRFSKKMA